jgi:hypothetical protein
MRSIGQLAIVVVVLAGCQRAVPTLTPARAPSKLATEFLVKETFVKHFTVGVTAHIPLAPAGPKPTVIALAGNTRQLMGAGFVAVTYTVNWERARGPVPTPPPRGAVGIWVLAAPSAGVLGERYLRDIAAASGEYVPAVIDWLATLPDVDAKRIGMVGSSTNGFITLQAVAVDRRIRAAVALAACGDYHGFLRDSSMGMTGKPLALDPDYERWIRTQEIIRHPERVVHSALLMINRVQDELIPVSCADETARVLQPAYAAAGATDRFRYIRREATGHGTGPEEIQPTMEWFEHWLKN